MSRLPPLAIVLVLLAGPIALASPLAQASDGPHAYVTGFVFDEAGNPLAGIVVEGYSYAPDSGAEVADRNVTDANGAYRLVLGEGKTVLSAYNEKTGVRTEHGLYLEADQTTEVDLTLERPPAKDAVVTGTVRGLDGKPIPGARVTIGGGCCYAYATPTSAEEPPATQPSQEMAPDETDSTTSAGSTTESDSRMSSMPIRCCYDNGGYAETVTDANGRYRLETFAGPRQLTASADEYAQTTVNIELPRNATIEQNLTLEKVPGETATLSGRVVDAKTGLPVGGAWIYVSNLEWNRYASAQSGRDGKFSLTTIPGWVQISIQPPHSCCVAVALEGDAVEKPASASSPEYRGFVQAFQLADGKSTRDYSLIPKAPATIVLTGYVVDPNTKKAVPDAWVNIWNQDSGDWGSARTDATGSYKLLVRAGVHQVTAYADGYLSGADTIVVESSDVVKRFDVQMPKGTAKYASCHECYREIAYSESGMADASTTQKSAAPTAAPLPPSESGRQNTAQGSGDASDGGSRPTTYEGTGGGLPPYDPAATGSTAAAENAATIPPVGLIGVLVASALVAIALRRRE